MTLRKKSILSPEFPQESSENFHEVATSEIVRKVLMKFERISAVSPGANPDEVLDEYMKKILVNLMQNQLEFEVFFKSFIVERE